MDDEISEYLDHPGVPVSLGNVQSMLVPERLQLPSPLPFPPLPPLSASLQSGSGRSGGPVWDPGQLLRPHVSPRATLRWGPGTVLLVAIYCG